MDLGTVEVMLPFGGTARIRAMTGREENILTNEQKVRAGVAVDELMAACTLELDGEKPNIQRIQALRSPDRLTLMVARPLPQPTGERLGDRRG